MKTMTRTVLCACLSLGAAGAFCQGSQGDSKAAADRTMNKDWTIQECRDYMANPDRAAPRNDDATVKHEARCAEMMKNDPATRSDDSTRRQNAAAEPRVMKKDWTVAECRDRMSRSKAGSAAQDDASGQVDRQCADLMKREGSTDESTTGSTKQ